MFKPRVGDEVIYRYRHYDTSDCVRILGLDESKKTPRYVVTFLTGPKASTIENVPARRLRGYWSDVAEYDQLIGNWERIDDYE